MSSNSHTPLGAYILTAYLPQDNWKKIKVKTCVADIIEETTRLCLIILSSTR